MSWNGRLILLARRAPLGDPARRFGISWFVGAVSKYRAVLGEVLLASFFLQVFALVTPLFFQVVIDKVLIHRGLSTLDVLMVGLAVIALFDVSLGGIRSYVFAHTTNRIDVELGALSPSVRAADRVFSAAGLAIPLRVCAAREYPAVRTARL